MRGLENSTQTHPKVLLQFVSPASGGSGPGAILLLMIDGCDVDDDEDRDDQGAVDVNLMWPTRNTTTQLAVVVRICSALWTDDV